MKIASKAFALLAASVLVTAAFGDSLKLTSGTYSNGSNGGAYTASNIVGTLDLSSYVNGKSSFAAGSFETFCLEPTEYFTSGNTYNYTISNIVFGGGIDNHDVSGNPAGDPLSKGTTWLYSQFAKGTLAGYSYTANSAQTGSSLLLQKAIWYLEDDKALSTPLSNTFLSLVAGHFGGGLTGLAAAQASATYGENGVFALNLTSGTTNQNKHQSQLYYNLKPTTTNVPDQGATVALLGLSLLGLAGFRRKFAAK